MVAVACIATMRRNARACTTRSEVVDFTGVSVAMRAVAGCNDRRYKRGFSREKRASMFPAIARKLAHDATLCSPANWIAASALAMISHSALTIASPSVLVTFGTGVRRCLGCGE
jgi:hypothetical protein